MMEYIEFTNEFGGCIEYIDSLKKVLNIATKRELEAPAYFSVIFVDEEKIHKLNLEYRGIDRVTDVITFALEDEKDMPTLPYRLLGDIYICIPRAKEQAIEYGHSFERELCFLAVHGFLHLLGYDHMEKEEEQEMFRRQEEILNEANIKR